MLTTSPQTAARPARAALAAFSLACMLGACDGDDRSRAETGATSPAAPGAPQLADVPSTGSFWSVVVYPSGRGMVVVPTTIASAETSLPVSGTGAAIPIAPPTGPKPMLGTFPLTDPDEPPAAAVPASVPAAEAAPGSSSREPSESSEPEPETPTDPSEMAQGVDEESVETMRQPNPDEDPELGAARCTTGEDCATASKPTRVKIAWRAGTDDDLGYYIYFAETPEATMQLAKRIDRDDADTDGPDLTTSLSIVDDLDLAPRNRVCFAISGFDSDGESARSDTECVQLEF